MAPAGIDGGDEAVHKASRPKSSSQLTLCWREMVRTIGTPPIFFGRRVDPRAIHLPQYKPARSRQGPTVRIHLPPAVSPLRTTIPCRQPVKVGGELGSSIEAAGRPQPLAAGHA